MTVNLVEFLASLLDSAGRASDMLNRSKHPPERDAEIRAELRKQLLQAVFAESPVIPNLFKLLRGGVGQFEAASLLRSLLAAMTKPNSCLTSFMDQILAKFLQNVETLGALL